MYNFLKKGAYMLFVASLAVGMVACDDDDPDYSHVTPPTVEVAASHISGVVTAMNGSAVSGASVKAVVGGKELSATTGADGAYVLSDLEKGTYALEVAAAGKLAVKGQVTLSKDGESAVFNAILTNEGQQVEVSATEEQKKSLVTETLPNNEEAEVKTDIVVPAAAVEDEEAVIVVTPVYSNAFAAGARAVENTMVLGMDVACTKEGVELKKPISLTFNVGAEMAKVAKVTKNVNGQSSAVAAEVAGDQLIVMADAFGTYSLSLDINFSQTTANEAISFSQDKFDNLYGAKDMLVTSATYTYKQGVELAAPAGGILAAHLRQVLAVKAGASSVKTATGTYELNVTLPIGTALNLKGSQQVITWTAAVGNASSSSKVYGNVMVSADTYNRDHIGGSSGL